MNSNDLPPTSSDDDSSASDSSGDAKGKRGNGAWLTAGIIVADVVGAGILGMPSAVAKFGWLLGAILLIVLLAANVHISILMWRVRMYSPGCSNAVTYSDLVRGTFARAPTWQRNTTTWLAGFAQKSFLYGLMGLYLLSAGKGFGMIFYEIQTCLPVWAAYAALLLLPFALYSRNLGSCEFLVWLNVATLCGTVFIPLLYYAINGTDAVRKVGSEVNALEELSVTGVLSGLSTYTFGLTSQFMLMEIISEMEDIKELPKAYASISAPFQLVMFLVAGVGGYAFMGNEVTGMLNENLPFNYVLRMASACMLTHMLISYLIKGVVFCKSLHKTVDFGHHESDDNRVRSWIGWMSSVGVGMVLSYVVANVVPFFGDAVDLLGASLTPLSCWVIPILCFLRFHYDAGLVGQAPKVSILEWIVIALEVVLASLLMVFGTYSVLQTIIADWAEYGSPFECHCQGMWNTCSCSSDHVGMDACHTPDAAPSR